MKSEFEKAFPLKIIGTTFLVRASKLCWLIKASGGMNWETGIDIYTVICIKWITNKNLMYKKINKIKLKRKRQDEHCLLLRRGSGTYSLRIL